MSEKALQYIAENRKTKTTTLYLTDCGLVKVPSEILQNFWLETLHLGRNNKLREWSPLQNLISLQKLSVFDTQVADLSPLKNLTNLRELKVYNTQVTDLSPLKNLTNLQILKVQHSQVADLSPLKNLTSLRDLDISHTLVTDLLPLKNLTSLRDLDAFHTQVTDLSPLKNLTRLQILDVSHTQVADLSRIQNLVEKGKPVRWSDDPWEGNGIYVKNCPLTTPPPEVVRQGKKAILNYFREREVQGIDKLYEAKLLLIGEGGAGKTSLYRRLCKPELSLPPEKDSTKGIDIHRYEFPLGEGRHFRLNVWDFGGQEIYHATHQFFLTKRSLYILLDARAATTKPCRTRVSNTGSKWWKRSATKARC